MAQNRVKQPSILRTLEVQVCLVTSQNEFQWMSHWQRNQVDLANMANVLKSSKDHIKTKSTVASLPGKGLAAKAAMTISKQSQLQPHFQAKAWLQKQQGPYQNKVNYSLTSRWRLGCKSSKDHIKTKSTTASLPGKGLAAKTARPYQKQSQLQPHFQEKVWLQKQQGRIKTKSTAASLPGEGLAAKAARTVSKQSQLQPHFQEKAWLQKQQGPYQNKVNYSLTSRLGCKSSKDRIKTKSARCSDAANSFHKSLHKLPVKSIWILDYENHHQSFILCWTSSAAKRMLWSWASAILNFKSHHAITKSVGHLTFLSHSGNPVVEERRLFPAFAINTASASRNNKLI